MRSLFLLIIIFSFLSCDQTQSGQIQTETKQESKFTHLLDKYKSISFDTLNVFSTDDPDNNQFKFKGVQIDSLNVHLFPKDFAEQYSYDNGFFACYKFSIDSSRLGLITRTPSTYVSSSIKLFIFDKQMDAITEYVELAETVGDAGDALTKDSWLFIDNLRKLQSFVWVQESHDNSVDNEKDTTVQNWDYYYLLDFSNQKTDTLSKDSSQLAKRFNGLIRQYANR